MSVRNFIGSSITLQGAIYFFFLKCFNSLLSTHQFCGFACSWRTRRKHRPGFHSNLETPGYSARLSILMRTQKLSSISNAGNVRIVHVSFGCISTSARLTFDLLPVVSHAQISHAFEVTKQNLIRAPHFFFLSCVRSSKTELSETLSYR